MSRRLFGAAGVVCALSSKQPRPSVRTIFIVGISRLEFKVKEDAMRRSMMLEVAAAVFAMVLCLIANGSAQTAANKAVSANLPKPAGPASAAAKAVPVPAMTEFRKVAVGTTADGVKQAWGKAEVEDATGFIYNFSPKEMAQVALDADKKVDTIAVTFQDGTGAPKAADVFGPKEKVERKENGSIFHMVRYPEAGYWVSYFSQGEGKAVIITYKKI